MHIDIRSAWLVGSLLLGLPFFAIYLLRKDLRSEILFGGSTLAPFALTAPFFIPEYWNPIYYFGLLSPFKAGIEDFIFCFFVGGISAAIFEFIERKREVKARKRRTHILWTPYILVWVCLMLGEYLFPDLSIITLGMTGLAISIYMNLRRKDLFIQSLSAGIFFAILYFLLFNLFNWLFPTYIAEIYTHKNLLGIYFLGIPFEEIFFAFSVGASWSIMYEYVLGYKTR